MLLQIVVTCGVAVPCLHLKTVGMDLQNAVHRHLAVIVALSPIADLLVFRAPKGSFRSIVLNTEASIRGWSPISNGISPCASGLQPVV